MVLGEVIKGSLYMQVAYFNLKAEFSGACSSLSPEPVQTTALQNFHWCGRIVGSFLHTNMDQMPSANHLASLSLLAVRLTRCYLPALHKEQCLFHSAVASKWHEVTKRIALGLDSSVLGGCAASYPVLSTSLLREVRCCNWGDLKADLNWHFFPFCWCED